MMATAHDLVGVTGSTPVVVGAVLLAVIVGSLVFSGILLLRRRSTDPTFVNAATRRGPAQPPNGECPVCGEPVVTESQYMRPMVAGPMFAPRPREELLGACAEHGHAPFNDMTVRWRASNETR